MEESIKSSKSKSTTSESRSLLLMIKVGRQKTGLRNIAKNLIRGGGRAYPMNECDVTLAKCEAEKCFGKKRWTLHCEWAQIHLCLSTKDLQC